eukprot:6659044-Prymnesium_polylepis.1
MAIVEAGARLIEEVTATGALQAYTAQLFRGYAARYQQGKQEQRLGGAPPPAPFAQHAARFRCVTSGQTTDCTFSAAASNRTSLYEAVRRGG